MLALGTRLVAGRSRTAFVQCHRSAVIISTTRSPIRCATYTSRSVPRFSSEELQEVEDQEVADADPSTDHDEILIHALEKQLEEFTTSWALARAETENVKKIMHRDVSRAREAGIDKLAKKIFPVSDTLDICIQNKPDFASPTHKNNVHAQSAFDGIHAAKSQLVSLLKEVHVEEVIPKLGEAFDPSFHDALFEMDQPQDKKIGPGTIGIVLKAGWQRDGTLLRPACVGVIRRA